MSKFLMRSVVMGGQRRLAGSPTAQLCQTQAARASSRWAMGGTDAFDGAAAVAFEVELALEGVVDRLDPLIERECGCGRRTKGPAPEGAEAPVQYGLRIAAIIFPAARHRRPPVVACRLSASLPARLLAAGEAS